MGRDALRIRIRGIEPVLCPTAGGGIRDCRALGVAPAGASHYLWRRIPPPGRSDASPVFPGSALRPVRLSDSNALGGHGSNGYGAYASYRPDSRFRLARIYRNRETQDGLVARGHRTVAGHDEVRGAFSGGRLCVLLMTPRRLFVPALVVMV